MLDDCLIVSEINCSSVVVCNMPTRYRAKRSLAIRVEQWTYGMLGRRRSACVVLMGEKQSLFPKILNAFVFPRHDNTAKSWYWILLARAYTSEYNFEKCSVYWFLRDSCGMHYLMNELLIRSFWIFATWSTSLLSALFRNIYQPQIRCLFVMRVECHLGRNRDHKISWTLFWCHKNKCNDDLKFVRVESAFLAFTCHIFAYLKWT